MLGFLPTEAVGNIVKFLGMHPCERSDKVPENKNTHTLLLAGKKRLWGGPGCFRVGLTHLPHTPVCSSGPAGTCPLSYEKDFCGRGMMAQHFSLTAGLLKQQVCDLTVGVQMPSPQPPG